MLPNSLAQDICANSATEIADAHEVTKAILAQTTKVARVFLDTFAQRLKVKSELEDLSRRQKQRNDSGFTPNDQNQLHRAIYQLSQSEQLAATQEFERKNFEYSQDMTRKITLQQENTFIRQARVTHIETMKQLRDASAILFEQIAEFASGQGHQANMQTLDRPPVPPAAAPPANPMDLAPIPEAPADPDPDQVNQEEESPQNVEGVAKEGASDLPEDDR